jgi:hypothetical protein
VNPLNGAYAQLGCLITGLFVFAALGCQANTTEVDWTSSGFSTSHITINAGDEVDIFNFDYTFDLQVTGAPPESFYADIPPTDGSTVYYVAYVYNNPGTFSFSDEFGDPVTVTVNPVTPLSVAITAPTNNAVFTAPATFTVTAVPSGGVTPYSEVDFYVGTNLAGVAYTSPFTCTVSNLWMANHNISAVVTDNNFDTATNSIQVSVAPLMVTNFIATVDCGTIYSSGSIVRFIALTMGSSTEGGLEFAAFNSSLYSDVLLEISPQGTPVWGNTVQVYGIDGRNGTLSGSDYGSGTYLGSFPVPANTPDGQPLLFNVTSFVKSAHGPYFAILIEAGPDLFGSASDYTGIPPGLFVVGPAPLPQLAAARAGNQIIISWPTNYSAGLTLKSTETLGKDAAWNPVNEVPVLSGNQWVVTNSVSGTNRLFRLSSQ